jgi:hypothetical protein
VLHCALFSSSFCTIITECVFWQRAGVKSVLFPVFLRQSCSIQLETGSTVHYFSRTAEKCVASIDCGTRRALSSSFWFWKFPSGHGEVALASMDAGTDAVFAFASPKKYVLCSPIRGARSARGDEASPEHESRAKFTKKNRRVMIKNHE